MKKRNCTVIHETILRDIVDVIKDVKDSDEVDFIKKRKNSFVSIANASSNLNLVFPVIVSSSMNIENASMIVKAVERKAVNMLQMLFSAINISDSKNGIDYISKFHNNLNISDNLSVDEFIDYMDSLTGLSESFVVNNSLYESVKRDLLNLSYTLPDNINEDRINRFQIRNNTYGSGTYVTEKASLKKKSNENNNDVGIILNKGNNNFTKKDNLDYFKNQLVSSDIKKVNELVPTTMVINFHILDDRGNNIDSQMMIGVKAKLYPVNSADIIQRITNKHVDKNWFLKLVKSTTREISFVRDFLFAIDKAKVDALSQSNRGSSSKLWKVLERRSLKSRVRRLLGHVNDASAISTLVITQEEVEYLKKTTNIDVEKPSVILPILSAYNLMCFIIVDDSMEIAKFIFDTGNDIYENISFSLLEREANDGSYKKIVNLMSKMR